MPELLLLSRRLPPPNEMTCRLVRAGRVQEESYCRLASPRWLAQTPPLKNIGLPPVWRHGLVVNCSPTSSIGAHHHTATSSSAWLAFTLTVWLPPVAARHQCLAFTLPLSLSLFSVAFVIPHHHTGSMSPGIIGQSVTRPRPGWALVFGHRTLAHCPPPLASSSAYAWFHACPCLGWPVIVPSPPVCRRFVYWSFVAIDWSSPGSLARLRLNRPFRSVAFGCPPVCPAILPVWLGVISSSTLVSFGHHSPFHHLRLVERLVSPVTSPLTLSPPPAVDIAV